MIRSSIFENACVPDILVKEKSSLLLCAGGFFVDKHLFFSENG